MKPPRRGCLVAILGLSLFFEARTVKAEPRASVLVIVDEENPSDDVGILDRVAAELRSIGFEVVVESDPAARALPLRVLAVAHRTRHAVRVLHRAPRVRIETFRLEDGSEEQSVREGEVHGESTYGPAALIAFKVAEEIGARWARDLPMRAPPAAEPPRSEEGFAPSSSRRPLRVSGFAGPGLLCSHGGLPCSLHARIGVNVGNERFELGLFGGPAFSLGDVTTSAGSARLAPHTAEASGALSFESKKVALRLGAGVMLIAGRLDASPAPGFTGGSSLALSLAPVLRISIRYLATPHLAPTLEVIGGTALPRTRLRLAGEDVARWGAAFVMVSAGLAWSP